MTISGIWAEVKPAEEQTKLYDVATGRRAAVDLSIFMVPFLRRLAHHSLAVFEIEDLNFQ